MAVKRNWKLGTWFCGLRKHASRQWLHACYMPGAGLDTSDVPSPLILPFQEALSFPPDTVRN